MPDESASTVARRRQTQSRPFDREIARLAERQHGVVGRTQLVELGMSESAVDRRVRIGRLHRLHPGVYSVGHRIVPREGRWLAVLLREGGGSALSHRSAAELWGIQRGSGRGPVAITSPRSTRSCAAIRRHCARLAPDEVTSRRRIPVTTLSRTLLDIAAVLPVEGLEAAIREAEYLHRLRVRDLEELLNRHPGRRGATTLRTCFRRLGHGPRGRVRNKLEARFAALIARTDLPVPQLNALLELDGRFIEADCLWREQRLVVELDGGKAHRTRSAFESDRERDRRLQAAGWRVVRITWRQLSEPEAVVDDLRNLLAAAETASAVE